MALYSCAASQRYPAGSHYNTTFSVRCAVEVNPETSDGGAIAMLAGGLKTAGSVVEVSAHYL